MRGLRKRFIEWVAVAAVLGGCASDKLPLLPSTPIRSDAPSAPAPSYPHFRENVMACTSKTALDQYIQALVVKDQAGVDFLVNQRRCIIPKSDLRISLLDRPSLGTAHVRVYVDASSTIELWTTIEALSGV